MVRTAAEKVAEYVTATGDDPTRWAYFAPPGFASVALFAAAPVFFSDPEVAPLTRVLIHTDQQFRWERPLPVEEDLEIRGRVDVVRRRRGFNLVTFVVRAGGLYAGDYLASTSTFLLSGDSAGEEVPEEGEPAHDHKGPDDLPVPVPLPGAGNDLPPLRKSASRADLIRYAGATRDWNPVHWDHDVARTAGLPGIVGHGLLLSAWMIQAAGRTVAGHGPLREFRTRFRRPLRPGVAAEVAARVVDTAEHLAFLRLSVVTGGDELVTGTATVRMG